MKYKVWMDKTNMGDDILVSMARAVENSYIVLLCINTQYYRSHYCRLEAEYAAEKRIRFIPCMVEKSFRAESWLGIIKGSSLHVDFSVHEKFKESFKELIRLISQIEKQLCVQPRRAPTPCNFSGRVLFGDMSATNAESPTHTHDQHTYRCNSIVEQYKRSIHKEDHDLKHLKHHQLLDLINKLLRQQSTTKTSRSSRYSYSEQSDEDTKQVCHCNQHVEKICNRVLDKNERFEKICNRVLDKNEHLIKQQDRLKCGTFDVKKSHSFEDYAFITTMLPCFLLCTLLIFLVKNEYII
ncbi:unnamed protein product [Rotaria socialis]|uniref:TIR domain-containing protein n=1 Tax=Rotaria socialis TaxID=392032 RepID=A0A820PLZ1_9BILA|nr:unnamed protein product [Rotaria socialis]CAF4408006.1 unnamed protein product [Rotaria socialis]CAF4443300.1 unnamed protein product [Rotaria socialis]